MTAMTVAERVRALRKRRKDQHLVRVELYLSPEQRAKLARLGGQAWVQARIDRAKEPKCPPQQMI